MDPSPSTNPRQSFFVNWLTISIDLELVNDGIVYNVKGVTFYHVTSPQKRWYSRIAYKPLQNRCVFHNGLVEV